MSAGYRRLLFSLLLLGVVGCQSLMQTTSQPIGEIADLEDSIEVRVRPAYAKAKQLKIPYEPKMTLQDVVDKSDAPFRNKFAHIIRTSPETGQNHKLEGNFGSNRRITLQTDYAVLPGDRVVIEQDTSSSFDRVLRTIMGAD